VHHVEHSEQKDAIHLLRLSENKPIVGKNLIVLRFLILEIYVIEITLFAQERKNQRYKASKIFLFAPVGLITH